MTIRRRTSRSPRVTCIAVVAGLVLLIAAPAAARQTDDPPTPTIELAARSSWVSDAEPLTLDVTTGGATAGTTMRVRIHPPLPDAAALETSLTENVGGITRTVDLGLTDEIPVSASGTRQIQLTGDDVRTAGVHPVVIELRTPDGGIVDEIRTPVIRLGNEDDPLAAPRLSVVVDFGADPTIGPEGRRDLTPTEIGRLGRLAAFLDAATALDPAPPISVVAVPDTIDALAASADPRAAALLDQLESTDNATPVAMPYVPVSAAALEDAGLGDVVEDQLAVGALALADRFADPADATLWPDDDVTAAAADRLAGLGVERVLTSGAAEDEGVDSSGGDGRLLVPAGPRPVLALAESGLAALVSDETTSAAVAVGAGDRVDAVPVALADLILRDDGRGSDVVVRIDDLPDGSLLTEVLPLLAAPDAPVPLVDLPTGDDGDLVEPVTLPTGSGDDLDGIADQYRSVQRDVATFDQFAGPDSARSAELGARQLTSVADGLDPAERTALLDSVEAVVLTGFDGVRLTGQTDLNLTSRTGALPVTVTNANDYPVRVMIRIRSDRLRFPDGEEIEVLAEPDITRLDIPVEALATGSVPTFVEVRTPDGSLLLDARQLNVRSTAVSGVGLALSLGALAVLAIWWIRTWRKGRNSRETGGISTS